MPAKNVRLNPPGAAVFAGGRGFIREFREGTRIAELGLKAPNLPAQAEGLGTGVIKRPHRPEKGGTRWE
jgi:hypothetical protein